MDVLPSIGGAGLGLVWGWLAGRVGAPMIHPARTVLLLAAASLISAAAVSGLAGFVPTLMFLAAVGIAAAFRHGWRRRLAARHARGA